MFSLFVICYFSTSEPTLDHGQMVCLTYPMLTTAFHYSVSNQGSPETLSQDWVPKPNWAPSGIWSNNLAIIKYSSNSQLLHFVVP